MLQLWVTKLVAIVENFGAHWRSIYGFDVLCNVFMNDQNYLCELLFQNRADCYLVEFYLNTFSTILCASPYVPDRLGCPAIANRKEKGEQY